MNCMSSSVGSPAEASPPVFAKGGGGGGCTVGGSREIAARSEVHIGSDIDDPVVTLRVAGGAGWSMDIVEREEDGRRRRVSLRTCLTVVLWAGLCGREMTRRRLSDAASNSSL